MAEKPGDIGILAELPPELRYLVEPALDVIRQGEDAMITGGADFDVFERAVRDAMSDLSADEAYERCTEHRAMLRQWLEQHTEYTESDLAPLHFLYGAMAFAPDIFLPNDDDEKPDEDRGQIAFDNVLDLSVEVGQEWVHFTDGDIFFHILNIDATSFETLPRQYDAVCSLPPPDPRDTFYPGAPVDWGERKGTKYLAVGTGERQLKELRYVLDVPGGYVHAQVSSRSNFDESKYERLLKTVRIER